MYTNAAPDVPMPPVPDAGLEVSTDRAVADAGAPGDIPSDRRFCDMRNACRATGGIARGDDLARLLQDHRLGDFVTLARHIVARDIFGFEWRHAFWVPMFQFELRDLSIKAAPRKVLDELAPVFEGWGLATWFVQPNSWLSDQRPMELLDSNLPEVLVAARTDRFIARG